MTSSTGSKGGSSVRSGRGSTKDHHAGASGGDPDSEPIEQEALTRAQQQAGGALCRLCYRPDGWLRFSPSADEGIVYIKFKFTCNRFYNRYVMVRIEAMWVEAGVRLLEEKIERVYDGTLTPVEDHWFKHL